jgi:ubiquinol-cytochrome c reductase cytochrome b subunit
MTPEASGNNKVKQLVHAVVDWFESRLGLGPALGPIFSHPVPKGVAGPMGWFYVFGSASMTMLGIQFVTGILLALVYVPSADKAYESLLYLNYHQQLGWFLRALHYYAGSAMVAMVLAHMTQVFLHGAYKYPRELTWIVGVFLFACTMGMFFTGQILRWDPDAYWGLAVGASMAGRVPVAGPWIVQVMLGSAIIGGGALSRFFALHVFVIPGALLGLLAVHLWLVLQCGVSAPPVPGQLVNPDTYKDDYHEELKTGVPFAGDALLKDIAFSAVELEPGLDRDIHHVGVPGCGGRAALDRAGGVQPRRALPHPPPAGGHAGHRDLHHFDNFDLPRCNRVLVSADGSLEG